ncbi:MAG: Na(+)/H(+) antiporter subunit D [gamma proteobacterium symbiont of Ctena orbiculata]|uniref:Na(+)/H(+) antiporter subunit D n=1 Tax=Candidatus Thiodiazotropha taylori TaxID=2792791 RepID=A0A944M7J9_9GAMM|nr:Na(+)/H(+) antiporter subunit D [Candidatus Thiodiazotropha taylori]PUB82195.1 MAG: Na(+)/H(+) antiporter subunit D [gamma proteobacterium symbiont of Ctena orbiculata]MBT2987714.1 Na(+)/H(+) antiporter subunit D [Candidatus Thiodiazotropha taylori]MBT2995044.1 Na(+)/H(+) antiporter subunit D [Candidatus Thiodiazotropha taylori]MBT3000037.1 Na(+)/H(+) antiporter subunit D [Candidatus Thiodiazotropha taylori]
MSELSPFLIYFLASLLVLASPAMIRNALLLATPVLAALHLFFNIEPGMTASYTVLEFEMVYLRADKLSLLFAYLFTLASFISTVFALHVKDVRQQVAGLIYAGSALGAVFAGDFLTLFIFWELLAISSVFLIWARDTERALNAGMRYLVFQVLSGVLLLAGALLHYQETGSLMFDHVGLNGLAGWLVFIAFGIKSAFPFLHSWLTDGYPEATPTGTVYLSAFTTKVAVYSLARGFAGEEILVYIGVTMACFPIFYAVIENDLRKVLAYSLINQVGFMVTGIGIGTALSLNGAVAHAFSDVIFKGLLFMSMGAVLFRVGHVNGSDLGGLYKTMPKTTGLCIVGAMSISAFPLFSGFVSKSMVMSAMLMENYDYLWLFMLFASAGVFHHAGIKIPYFAFFAHDSGLRPQEAPLNMLVAMALAAFVCLFIGSQPQYLYALLPWEVDYWPYDLTHVLTQTQLLFFSALAFVWLNKQGLYPPELHSTNLDAEWVYRKFLPAGVQRGLAFAHNAKKSTVAATVVHMNSIRRSLSESSIAKYNLSESWPTGSMVLWISFTLVAYLLLDIFIYK